MDKNYVTPNLKVYIKLSIWNLNLILRQTDRHNTESSWLLCFLPFLPNDNVFHFFLLAFLPSRKCISLQHLTGMHCIPSALTCCSACCKLPCVRCSKTLVNFYHTTQYAYHIPEGNTVQSLMWEHQALSHYSIQLSVGTTTSFNLLHWESYCVRTEAVLPTQH
jgi:hypothetical protein